jgi:hypothetical protein
MEGRIVKRYKVTLKNNRDKFVDAKSYHKDGEHYVFEARDPDEVQFFLISEVIGVTVLKDEIDRPGGGFVSIPL